MAAKILDPVYLSTYLNVPLSTINSVLDSPTVQLVQSVLEAVTLKAREYEELQADKLRVDIELENAVRSSESRSQGLKATAEKALKDAEELRHKLQAEENKTSLLETELQTLRSSSSTSAAEIVSLNNRISCLESANRDTLAVLESKSTAYDALGQDLQKQHQKALDLGQQVTALQQTIQNNNSAVSSAKFRQQNLEQELALAKRNNDWFEAELKTKSAEAMKFRKEKGARIAELQRQNDEANSNLTAAKRNEQALRTRLEEVQKKAEDSFAKIQELQESAATMQEGFRQELESARRLADLQSQQTETHRNRLMEVEAALDKVRNDAADEIGQARQETENENANRVAAETRIAELEARIDELEVSAQTIAVSRPRTPRQGLNGSVTGTPGSPAFATPGSSRKIITATQAVEQLHRAKIELAAEKRRNAQLSAEVEEMMQGLEAKQPEIEELQVEHERLQQEVVEMSKAVDQTGAERDQAKKEARVALSAANMAQTEVKVLQQQSRDLGIQIKVLLCELGSRDDGLEGLSAAEKTQLERIARGEISEEALATMSDTDQFISQRLVVFRNISELQEKNAEMLTVTRKIAAQMESEEALAAKHEAAKDHEEVVRLREKVNSYKDELDGMIIRSQSYIKERDMFRRMLQYRGQLPPDSDLGSVFGQSVDENGNGVIPTIEQSPNAKINSDNGKLLRELQSHFDQYREEQSIDRRTLKEQAEKLAADKSSLQAEIAKIGSQLAHANERYEMLQANYNMLQNENGQLQQRCQLLFENAAKQDLRTEHVAEDLIEVKGLLESMRNENANLKAEKTLWKDIQDRLSQDNESLMNERSRLNSLLANQQSLQNERDISESETRRRLLSNVESLESELTLTKRKLSEEVEENKKAALRREYDTQQTQKRIDDLMASLSTARENLVEASTTRNHLQARVDELSIELKSAEEKIELLQPKPTHAGANGESSDNGQESERQESIRREQELGIEISELKRDLDLAKTELESTKSQMEQYKQISQQSEEELQSINETQDQYRETMDKIIEEKESKITELQQRVEDISSELSATNDELTSLRNQQSELTRHSEEEKAALDTEITRLKEETERHRIAASFHKKDLRIQAEIATKAQQDYETELVKHAEAAKTLHSLRAEYNKLKSQAATFRTEAESAKVTLTQNQSSWDERNDQLEREMAELRTRRDEVSAQNKLLHQQLESVTQQISALQQSRATLTEDGESETPGNTGTNDRSVEDLREIVKYLRREKEIVEVQYELSQQEAKRVTQQLQYAQSQLDETRLKLDQERRSQADGVRSSIAHDDLMSKLNELNLHRESNITLRNELRQANSRLAEKTKQVEKLLEQIKPMETRIMELESARDLQEGEIRLLQEDRDRWQKRTQEIISKYDRIDPAEMEALKESIATLKAERDAAIAGQEPLREQAASLEEEKKKWQQNREKLIEQSKNRNRDQNKTIADRTAERDASVQEKGVLEEKLSTLREELQTISQEKSNVERRIETLKLELETAKSDAAANAGSSELTQVQQELQSTKQSKDALEKELETVRAELSAARQEVELVKAERDEALAKAAAVPLLQSDAQDDEEGQIKENSSSTLSDQERQALELRVVAAEAKVSELEEQLAETVAGLDTQVKTRCDKMKDVLNKRLRESKDAITAEVQKEYEARLAQDKAIWIAENATHPTPPVASVNPVAIDVAPTLAIDPKARDQAVDPNVADHTPSSTTSQKPNGDGENTLSGLPELSDVQVRELLSAHPTIKSIVANNIKTKLEICKSEIELAAEQKLADAEKKAEDAKAAAVAMETKKQSLKLNMTENRLKVANVKLEVVETAATETPDRAVGEVWEVAKNAKVTPPAPAVNKDSITTSPGQNPFAKPNPETSSLPQPAATAPTGPATAPTGPAAANGSFIPVSSVLPHDHFTAHGQNANPHSQVPVPTHPTGNRSASGSGIPRVSGIRSRGPNRGAPGSIYNPPGSRNRPFAPNNNNNNNNPNNHASRPSGGLNPFASDFSPGAGNKRPREDGSGGLEGNGAKRSRGAGRGS